MKLFISLFICCVTNCSFGQTVNCRYSFLDGNKYIYENKNLSGRISIKKEYHIEKIKIDNKKIVIKSRIDWLDTCKVQLTIVKIKGKSPVKIGDSVTFTIVYSDFYQIKYVLEGSRDITILNRL